MADNNETITAEMWEIAKTALSLTKDKMKLIPKSITGSNNDKEGKRDLLNGIVRASEGEDSLSIYYTHRNEDDDADDFQVCTWRDGMWDPKMYITFCPKKTDDENDGKNDSEYYQNLYTKTQCLEIAIKDMAPELLPRWQKALKEVPRVQYEETLKTMRDIKGQIIPLLTRYQRLKRKAKEYEESSKTGDKGQEI